MTPNFRCRPPWTLPLLLAIALPLTAAEALAAPVAAEWILARLARPAPQATPFVELRGSPLLKTPLRISGEFRRMADGTLVREVRAPYGETTAISGANGGEVVVTRAGKPPRRFALSRAPELAALHASFGALLSGDRDALERDYRIDASGRRERWTLALAPKHAGLAKQVDGITLYGRGAELRCIETQLAGQPVQRTLLAGAAHRAGADLGADALAALCHGDDA